MNDIGQGKRLITEITTPDFFQSVASFPGLPRLLIAAWRPGDEAIIQTVDSVL